MALAALGTVFFSHFILYYCWVCIISSKGALLGLHGFWTNFTESDFTPTVTSMCLYVGFLLVQALLAVTMPGPVMEGLPLKGGIRLKYLCNGLVSWYVTLAIHTILHFTGVLPLHRIADQFGPLMTSAVIVGNLMSLFVWIWPIATGQNEPDTSLTVNYFFMGVWLNPRFGILDLKMFAEIRVSWILLFLLTASFTDQQYRQHGMVTSPMMLIVLAHFLYTNACMKGEECIPTTWDIFHERWGWMLVFWNLAGVPFLYCLPGLYISQIAPFEHPTGVSLAIGIVLLLAYYIWDTANSQKNRYRMVQAGTYIERNAFPQLPWGTLRAPKELKMERGTLLVDGWWQFVRKPHYAGDMVMALCWGLACGFGSFLPYLYFFFLSSFLIHRCKRDGERLAIKYGDGWQTYCRQIPYILVPYVY